MPIVSMNVDYMRKKKQQPQKEETYQRVLKQFSMSPQRFRFEKFNHKKLGVIHPKPTKQPKIKNHTSIPQPAIYQQGDKDFMEVKGKKCPITDVEPDIMYTKNDKKQLDEHLLQPFFYVQKVFPTGKTPQLEHNDVFVPFQTLKQSKRKRQQQDTDYINILKQMDQQQRQEFYTKGQTINIEYAMIFKRFMKGLIMKGLLEKDYKMATHTPKIKRNKILKQAAELRLIESDIQQLALTQKNEKSTLKSKQKNTLIYHQIPITYENMRKFLKTFDYEQKHIDEDLQILFTNVIIGDSLKQMSDFKSKNVAECKINLNAFLYNVKKYMKLKYKIKNLLSVNAAKQRNVYIKFSLYLFLGEGWRVFKKQLSQLEALESIVLQKVESQKYQDYILKRNELIRKKRVWSKNLQRTPLQYILLKFQKVKEVYVKTINYNSERIDLFNQFQIQFFDQMSSSQFSEASKEIHMNEAVDFLIQKQYTREESNEIIEFLKKILKSYNLIKAPIKSKWQLAPEVQPEQILSQSQIVNYLSAYSHKQVDEWRVFKEFLGKFHDFQVEKVTLPEDRLKNVRQAWECNLIGEWLIKQLKKMDKKIQIYLNQGLSICRLLNQDELNSNQIESILEQNEICSFDKFCEESTFNELKNFISALERNQLRTESQMKNESWDSDLTLAIQQYQVISDKMQQNKKKLEYNQKIESKPQTLTEPQQIISAANLIDDRSILQENQTQPKKPEIKITKQAQIIKPQEQLVGQPKPDNATQSIKTNYSSATMLSEAELDMKIQNAMKLQNRIYSELGNIKDLQFRPIK